jgi:riboflavin synthase
MFTGIVEEAGKIAGIAESPDAIRLRVESSLCSQDAHVGDSIAVNGCCLTVVEIENGGHGNTISFDLLRETWQRTNLSEVHPGSMVNLERALPVNARLHGHFVSGHIDGTGTVDVVERRGADWHLRIAPPAELLRYIVFKGSIAVDGISLTVANVTEFAFSVWIIPHTWEVTALKQRRAGDRVNLEADLLAKYVEKIISGRG